MNLLHENHFKTMDSISFDYTYQYPRKYPGRTICGVSSDSLQYHYEIMLQMVLKEQIPDNAVIFEMLQNYATFLAQEEFAKMGDLSLRRLLGNGQFGGFFFFFCPERLSNSQVLRLRMWYEYMKKVQTCQGYHVLMNNDFVDYEDPESISIYLQQQRILDDEYVLSLVKENPDYADFYGL